MQRKDIDTDSSNAEEKQLAFVALFVFFMTGSVVFIIVVWSEGFPQKEQ